MERQFYSYRKGRRESLTGPFFTAYGAMLERLIIDLQFTDYLSPYSDGYGIDYGPAKAKLQELIGTSWTPFDPYNNLSKPQTDVHVLDVIEAFCELTSKRGSYEREVNILFKRFNQPYRLEKGTVKRHGSEVLEEIWRDEIRSTDAVLIRYIDSAVDDFFYAKEDRRLEGLRSLYDAYERLKSSLNDDKKRSCQELIERLSPELLRGDLNAILTALTSIGNQANIRHSEHRVTIIDHNPDLIEFLFYTIYGLLRTALRKLAAPEAVTNGS